MSLDGSLIVLFLHTLLIAAMKAESNQTNSYYPDYGVFIGEIPDPSDVDAKGRVYVINETALQIINFTYNGKAPDLYFWLDRGEIPSPNGLKLPSFEYGIAPIGSYKNAERVVLILSGLHKIAAFRSFSLYSLKFEHNYGTVLIPDTLTVPRPQFLASELRGSRYNVGSGPILIIDRRTIKIFGFTFDGDKAPDGYFFVGRGPNVAHDAGVKVPIRGRDTSELITAMNERYRGGQDIIIQLPVEYDINHIDWLSIYCYKFRVDFGHVSITNVSQRIPPYVPPQKKFDDLEFSKTDGWPLISLLGSKERLNFTFQLGPPGGRRGYQFMARARPAKYVWYVNGYMADIYLQRGVTYTFNVEGGDDKSTTDFYNPLYISDDPFGGYLKLSNEERKQVKIIAGHNPNETAGRLCLWSFDGMQDEDPDKFNTFTDFRHSLKLKCAQNSKTATFQFMPTAATPDTLYYQSYTTYNMGWKINIVNNLPKDIADFVEEPYQYEKWLEQHNFFNAQKGTLSAATTHYIGYPLIALLLSFSLIYSTL